MILRKRERVNLNDPTYYPMPNNSIEKTYGVKCAKRGNDVYIKRRIKDRLRGFGNISKLAGGDKIHGLFITLTCDPSQYEGVKEAWDDISHKWNKFITWVKRKRKKGPFNVSHKFIGFFRVYEAFKKKGGTARGFPHIHAILFFSNKTFIHNDLISKQWGAFTKTKACRSVNKSVNYLVKYLTKSMTDKEHLLTPAMLWVNNKRSFGLSKNLFNLIQYMHNSNHYQKKLFGGIDETQEITFIGIYSIEWLRELSELGTITGVKMKGWYLDFEIEKGELW